MDPSSTPRHRDTNDQILNIAHDALRSQCPHRLLQYSIIFSFHLAKLINHPDPGWDRKVRYCWFSHDVTKIQTTKLSILLRFYFHGVLNQLKTNFQTNVRLKRVLGFVMECAWISKLLRDAAFTWRPRELSYRLKNDLFQEILLSKQFMY